MTLRGRYLLISAGIIIFLLAAPVAILGIQGYFYDFGGSGLIKTGIVVAKTEPKGALITLQGSDKTKTAQTSKTIRFLSPGDYNITIQKEDYFDWQKRLTVRGGGVTWLDEMTGTKKLIPEEPGIINIETPLPPKEEDISSDYIYAFENTSDGNLTLIGRHKNNPNDIRVLVPNIPYRRSSEVIIGPGGLVFVLLDRTLYQVSSDLEYLADGVDFALWDKNISKLVYGNANELNTYNPYDAGSLQRELISRTSEVGGSFCFMPNLGYALRSYGTVLRAIELDGRDRRNIYEIFKSENNIEIVECQSDGKKVAVRDGTSYKILNLKP